MDPRVLAISIPIISTIAFFTTVIFWRRYNNMERMAMIERGMNPADLTNNFKTVKRKQRDPFRLMRLACAVIGVGIGLFVGNVLRSLDFFDRGGIVAGLVCICGGIGLLVGYFLQISLQNKGVLPQRDMDDESDIL